MRHLTIRLTVAVFVVIIALTAVGIWFARRSPSVEKTLFEAAPAQVPITCCELIQNPDRYYSKIVRIRAVLLGYHELALYDPACKGIDKYIRADFDSASRKNLIKAITDLNGAGVKEGNFWVEVLLDGRFERLADPDIKTNTSDSGPGGHKYIKYRFRLVVTDLEGVSALAPDATWPP